MTTATRSPEPVFPIRRVFLAYDRRARVFYPVPPESAAASMVANFDADGRAVYREGSSWVVRPGQDPEFVRSVAEFLAGR